MGLFGKKKPKQEQLKKLELVINRDTLMAEYHCPYCNQLLVDDNPRLIQKPDIEFCPTCHKEFLK